MGIIAVAYYEFKMQLRRPAFWVSTLIIMSVCLLTASPSNKLAILYYGPWYAAGYAFGPFSILYSLISGILAGDRIIRDEQLLVNELIRSTPLSLKSYVLGKYLGAFISLFIPAIIVLAATAIEGATFNFINKAFTPIPYFFGLLVLGLPCVLWSSALGLFGGTAVRSYLWFSLLYAPFWLFFVFLPFRYRLHEFPDLLGSRVWGYYFELQRWGLPLQIAYNWAFMLLLVMGSVLGLLFLLKWRRLRAE